MSFYGLPPTAGLVFLGDGSNSTCCGSWHAAQRHPEGKPQEPADVSHGRLALHHAFMNQKIIPMSPIRWVVKGVGRPARKYQSRPRWVRMPGVSVTLVS